MNEPAPNGGQAVAGGEDLTLLAAQINLKHSNVEAQFRRGLEWAIDAGDDLLAAKAAVRHGEWLAWVRENLNVPARTASAYMRLASNRQRVADFQGSFREALAFLSEPASGEAEAAELDLGEAPSAAWICSTCGDSREAGPPDRTCGRVGCPLPAEQRSPDEIRARVAEMGPTHHARDIAAELGIPLRDVLAILAETGAHRAEAPQGDENPDPAVSSPAPAGEPPHGDSEASQEDPPAAERLAPLMSSESDEWYTPAWIWEAALDALDLGRFDLDPCAEAPDPARPGVVATRHFRVEDDGLAQEWRGVVFMNPPYSAIDRWVDKLAEECHAGRVEDFVALVPARVETRWWRKLTAGTTQTVVFLNSRVKFDAPSGEAAFSAPFPSALVFGYADPDDVAVRFRDLGRAWRAVE